MVEVRTLPRLGGESVVLLKGLLDVLIKERQKTVPVGFTEMVRLELLSARVTHPAKFSSLHEAHSVLLEEVEEFWDEVKKKADKRDYSNMLKELVQIATLCQRTAEDLLKVVGEK